MHTLRSAPPASFVERLRKRLKDDEAREAAAERSRTLNRRLGFAAALVVVVVALLALPWVRASSVALRTMAPGAERSPEQSGEDGPRFVNGTTLARPSEYREWVFLSSGLGMTYQSGAAAAATSTFGNVFVNPSAYRNFMRTGAWPNGTIFVLELRRSSSDGSINRAGRYQTQLVGLEAEVKDSRFPGGWAFYALGNDQTSPPLAAAAPCIECHTRHGAVEQTFVQFYPTLLDVARQKGTLKADF
jgi:hypothetical protein